ncbi:SemiSWEET family sugar transporter [Synechococcus sp. MU1650]|uniref:SemiSWEET family sugar transporter n=1 Tax=Synechococcus sp. MU1650 TaxID=2508352 RepID=UPI001CF8D60E|nr:SemiSWEET transporter [Synechococcus sp. MU1650]
MQLSSELVGYLAAGLTRVSFFPQAIKTLRSGDTKSISLGMYGLFTSGVALWSLYGLLVKDGPVLVANLITLVPAAVVLQRKIVGCR